MVRYEFRERHVPWLYIVGGFIIDRRSNKRAWINRCENGVDSAVRMILYLTITSSEPTLCLTHGISPATDREDPGHPW